MRIGSNESKRMGTNWPRLRQLGCSLLLPVLLLPLLAGCLNSPTLGGGDRRTDPPGPVGLDVTVKNNGSKSLPTWLNITGPGNFVARESFELSVDEVRNFSYALNTRGIYGVTIDWVTKGESVELAGQTLTSDGFRASTQHGFDMSKCPPNSKVKVDAAVWYYNAGNPVLNPIMKHGIHFNSELELCDTASSY